MKKKFEARAFCEWLVLGQFYAAMIAIINLVWNFGRFIVSLFWQKHAWYIEDCTSDMAWAFELLILTAILAAAAWYVFDHESGKADNEYCLAEKLPFCIPLIQTMAMAVSRTSEASGMLTILLIACYMLAVTFNLASQIIRSPQ